MNTISIFSLGIEPSTGYLYTTRMRKVTLVAGLSMTLCIREKRCRQPLNSTYCDSGDQTVPTSSSNSNSSSSSSSSGSSSGSGSGSSSSSGSSSKNSSDNSTGNDTGESPCSLYNSMEHRISWAERRNRCNSEKGCKFLGRRFTGSCVRSLDSVGVGIEDTAAGSLTSLPILQSEVQLQNSSHSGNSRINIDTAEEVLGNQIEVAGSNDDDAKTQLRVLVQETFTSSAVDSIRDSQLLANELAKRLLIEVLQRKENRGKFGELLQYMFISNTVLSPTRELIYWSLTLDNTVDDIAQNVKLHRDFWLRSAERQATTKRSLERRLTDAALLGVIIRWLDDPVSRTQVVIPLLDWTLQEHESVIAPLTELAADSIPWTKVSS